jgi:hypothetical protein
MPFAGNSAWGNVQVLSVALDEVEWWIWIALGYKDICLKDSCREETTERQMRDKQGVKGI